MIRQQGSWKRQVRSAVLEARRRAQRLMAVAQFFDGIGARRASRSIQMRAMAYEGRAEAIRRRYFAVVYV